MGKEIIVVAVLSKINMIESAKTDTIYWVDRSLTSGNR